MTEYNDHRERMDVLEESMGVGFYRTGQYHSRISDAMEKYREDKWIKFEDEEPPHSSMDWLLTIEFGNGSRCVNHCYRDQFGQWYIVSSHRSLEEIGLSNAKPIAWMPVPAPLPKNDTK